MDRRPLIETTTNPSIITNITNSRQKVLLDTGSIPSVYSQYILPSFAATATNESPEDNRTTRFIADHRRPSTTIDFVQGPVRQVRPSHQGQALTTITDSPSIYCTNHTSSDASASNDIDGQGPTIDGQGPTTDKDHRPTTTTTTTTSTDKSNQGQEHPRTRQTEQPLQARLAL